MATHLLITIKWEWISRRNNCRRNISDFTVIYTMKIICGVLLKDGFHGVISVHNQFIWKIPWNQRYYGSSTKCKLISFCLVIRFYHIQYIFKFHISFCLNVLGVHYTLDVCQFSFRCWVLNFTDKRFIFSEYCCVC